MRTSSSRNSPPRNPSNRRSRQPSPHQIYYPKNDNYTKPATRYYQNNNRGFSNRGFSNRGFSNRGRHTQYNNNRRNNQSHDRSNNHYNDQREPRERNNQYDDDDREPNNWNNNSSNSRNSGSSSSNNNNKATNKPKGPTNTKKAAATPHLKAKDEIVPNNHCNLFIGARWEKVIEKGENRKSKGLHIGGKNGICPVFLNVDTLTKLKEKDLNQSNRARSDSIASNNSGVSTSTTKQDLVAHCIFLYPQADVFFEFDAVEKDEEEEDDDNNQKEEYKNFSEHAEKLAEKLESDITEILTKFNPQRGMVFFYDKTSLGKYRPIFLHVLDKMENIYEWNYEPSVLESRKIDDNDAGEKKKSKNRNDMMNKCAELLLKLSEKWHKEQDSVSAIEDGEFEFYDRK